MSETQVGPDNDVPHTNGFKDFSYRLQASLNPNYFVPNESRVDAYLHLNRSLTTFNPDFLIPVGVTDYIRYAGYERGAGSDRAIGSYQAQLFPDDFEMPIPDKEETTGWTAEYMLREMKRRERPERIFGGYDESFKPGKTVLDIASGQALSLLQLALKFPDTSFIGTDILYDKERQVFPGKRGLQLTRSDWKSLRIIPDTSVDTILSCQGIGMWGVPGGANGATNDEDGQSVISAITRVSKPGAVVRIDANGNALGFLKENMDKNTWEVHPTTDLFIARKK